MTSIIIAVLLCVVIWWLSKTHGNSASQKHLYSASQKHLYSASKKSLSGKNTLELFYISVEDGQVEVLRGRLPTGLLVSFHDILSDSNVSGTVMALKKGKDLRLVCSGNLRKGLVQRLRNTFFLHRYALEKR